LNPCDVFLWDFLKEKAFPARPANMEFRATIIQLCGDITEDLFRNVTTNIGVQLQEVIGPNCGHVERVL
jgi:hypothetical protein